MARAPDLLDKLASSVARWPGRTAVVGSDTTFTYAELDRVSNRLANRLRSLGVNRDSRVGVSLPRGAGELVALLATSKAGGAYVPLDPSHPTERLQLVIEDAAPQVMILHPDSPLRGAVPPGTSVLAMADASSAGEGQLEEAPAVERGPDQLAYVLFTSGSTGRPKGVEITRGAFANFLRSMAHTPGMSADDRLLAVTTTSFDISGLELFLPLCVGATVVIADRDTIRDARLLRRKLEESAITVMQATPATWRLLLEAGWRGDGKLRMLCGGEALSATLADRLLAAGGELWNLYGPTETTVWSTLERVRPGHGRITIGRPIDETQVYVLDEAMNLVPPGREGELWIGGSGLARGYLGRGDLTAERFVQNPHGPPGDRIYRTGDLGRALPDGRFECLGRLDHQVKINGFRVELGEIEAALRAVPGVAEALVVADHRREGDPMLVAYWVGEAQREALLAEAARRLPSYMVPSACVRLPAFPLNTNGKIDRKRLPAPGALAQDAGAVTLGRNDAEVRIAAVWRDLLGLENVPIDQSFFTLGGTSVLAMQAVVRIERETGVALPLQVFFESPTVEGLAARLGKACRPDDPIVVWLRRGNPELAPLFCLLGVNLYQELARSLPGKRPVVGVHIPFRYSPGFDPRPSLASIAERYVSIIQDEQPSGPYHLLGLCFGGVVAYEVARTLEARGEEVASVAVLDAVLPGGIRIAWLHFLRDLARRILAGDLGGLGRSARNLARRLVARWKRVSGGGPLATPVPLPPTDLLVDGPAADAAVAQFSATPTWLDSRLLIVRATDERSPSWMAIQADYGWADRARNVVVHDIATTHLGILREPHVRSLAAAVAEGHGQDASTFAAKTPAPCASPAQPAATLYPG